VAQRTIGERGKVSATRKGNLASSHNYSKAMLGTLPLGKSLGCWIAENLSRRQNCSSIALMHSGPFRDFPSCADVGRKLVCCWSVSKDKPIL
jgi:hypothetical protein